ncbi:class I SAM-dependent methyltransferase [Pricia sp.]|uniref:class I SAM-dependent methyltransferase n=1 Tax=Pricia sp. TaxID=2268138 RepID=UPI0035937E55
MKKEIDTDEVQEIAAQLRCPTGKEGIKTASLLNQVNINMTLSGINNLQLAANDRVLELGHGNCGHLDKILTQASEIIYFGLEISSLMQSEAEKLNKASVKNKRASFHTYDGHKIPFENDSFDKIMTVNTLYFWERPLSLLNEIYRVLKPKGKCTIVFVQKSFMENLPFARYGFQLYGSNEIKTLMKPTSFKLIKTKHKKELVKDDNEQFTERPYSIVVLEK